MAHATKRSNISGGPWSSIRATQTRGATSTSSSHPCPAGAGKGEPQRILDPPRSTPIDSRHSFEDTNHGNGCARRTIAHQTDAESNPRVLGGVGRVGAGRHGRLN